MDYKTHDFGDKQGEWEPWCWQRRQVAVIWLAKTFLQGSLGCTETSLGFLQEKGSKLYWPYTLISHTFPPGACSHSSKGVRHVPAFSCLYISISSHSQPNYLCVHKEATSLGPNGEEEKVASLPTVGSAIMGSTNGMEHLEKQIASERVWTFFSYHYSLKNTVTIYIHVHYSRYFKVSRDN
jgi:hypothetical protein